MVRQQSQQTTHYNITTSPEGQPKLKAVSLDIKDLRLYTLLFIVT